MGYEDCWKQFELSYKTVNPNDYENGIFHFLCIARVRGVERALKSMLKIEGDKRAPMKEIYALYQPMKQAERDRSRGLRPPGLSESKAPVDRVD